MKHVVYECDWCGGREPASHDDEWPKGWSNLDELGNDDTLCVECLDAARFAIKDAIEAAKLARRPGAPNESDATKERP